MSHTPHPLHDNLVCFIHISPPSNVTTLPQVARRIVNAYNMGDLEAIENIIREAIVENCEICVFPFRYAADADADAADAAIYVPDQCDHHHTPTRISPSPSSTCTPHRYLPIFIHLPTERTHPISQRLRGRTALMSMWLTLVEAFPNGIFRLSDTTINEGNQQQQLQQQRCFK